MFLRDCTRHESGACHFMNISRCYILAVMYLLIVTTVDINDLFCIHIEIVNDTVQSITMGLEADLDVGY